MSTPLHLVPADPLSEADAIDRLIALGNKPVNATRLALECGWSRSKMRRLIARCRAEGKIPHAGDVAGDARKPVAPAAQPVRVEIRETPPAETMEHETRERAIDLPRDLPAFIPSQPDRKRSSPPPPPPSPPDLPIRVVALVLGVSAIALGGVGFLLNVAFAQNYGTPGSWTGDILSVLFGLIDILTIVIPTVARHLWTQRQRPMSLLAWLIWPGLLAMTLIAASSFTATNIGDNIEQRAKATQESGALQTKLAQLRHSRAQISETRSVAAIEAAIQQEQPRIPAANWKASLGCTTVTLSGKECAAINALREAKGNAEQRDKLDAQITAAADAFARLPALAAADPGADMAAKLFTIGTLGAINVPPQAIQQIRIFGLTLAPALSGLLLMFAAATWRARRDDSEMTELL